MLMPLILWILIILLFFPFYIISMSLFLIYRLIVNFIVWAFHPELIAHLTSRDIVFTSDDFEGKVRKNLMDLAIIDGHFDINEFREEINKRILVKPYFNRLNCRPIIFMGYYFWKRLDYKVASQISLLDRTITDYAELKTLFPSWSQKPYTKDGPLWSILVARMSDNRTAIGFKIHHMVGDGVCFMKLLEAYVDPKPGWKNIELNETKPFSWLHWIWAWYNFPWVSLKAYRLARIRKGFRPQALSGPGFSSWTTLPSHKIKTIRKLAKTSYATVLAGILSNAIYRLLLKSGKASDIPKTLRLVVPVPWPKRPKGRMSNHVAFVHSELPLGGGLSDFHSFEKSVKESYISGLHGIVWSVFRGSYLVPSPLLHRYTSWGERNIPPIIFSSVPGPVNHVYMMGFKIIESIPLLSLGCTMGLNVCVTTVANETTFGIRVSKEVLSSQDLLDQLTDKYLHEELDFFYQKLLQDEKDKSSAQAKEHHIKIEMS